MRSGFYQNTLSEILAFKKRRRFGLMFMLCGILLFGGLEVRGQVPQQLSFQGVARDASGKIIANSNIRLRFLIFRNQPNPADGITVFDELNDVSTNQHGIFTAQIGSQGGPLSGIDWNAGPHFLNVQIDPTGGNSFIDLGTTQLLSVPYAMVATKLPDLDPIVQTGQYNTGKTLTSFSPAPSLIWYPRISAFKVGAGVTNASSFGLNSVALGFNSIASADFSVALGTGTIANVTRGIVMGRYNDIPLANLDGTQQARLFQIGKGGSNEVRENALTILANGNMGLGTNVLSPEHLLDVGGRVRIRHNGNQTAGIFLDSPQTKESGFLGMKSDSEVGFFIGSNWRFWVNAQGNGYLNGNIIQTSDRRLKRDFSPVTNSLSKLTNLTGQHYFWKDTTKSQELQTGLIAQEVEQYFPELVTTDEKGFKAVNYIGLIPHLIESVKALKAQTETIGALEKQMNELRAEVKSMKTETVNNLNLISK